MQSMDQSKNTELLVPLTNILDMRTPIDRFYCIRTIINIARIIATIESFLPDVLFSDNYIIKKVSLAFLPCFRGESIADRVEFLSTVYNYAKGHEGLVQVEKVTMSIWNGFHLIDDEYLHGSIIHSHNDNKASNACPKTSVSYEKLSRSILHERVCAL